MFYFLLFYYFPSQLYPYCHLVSTIQLLFFCVKDIQNFRKVNNCVELVLPTITRTRGVILVRANKNKKCEFLISVHIIIFVLTKATNNTKYVVIKKMFKNIICNLPPVIGSAILRRTICQRRLPYKLVCKSRNFRQSLNRLVITNRILKI